MKAYSRAAASHFLFSEGKFAVFTESPWPCIKELEALMPVI
jgi:hypothetical protein